MSRYSSYYGVAALHQQTYPKRRPARHDVLREAAPAAVGIGDVAPDPSYQEFINGDFQVDAVQLTA